jgi:hypothetical protein
VKLRADDPGLFAKAVELLVEFNSTKPTLRDQNFAVAIAALLHRERPGPKSSSSPPRLLATPDSGEPASNRVLEVAICDHSYEKDTAFLPREHDGPIYKPFTRSFKNRSFSPHNNWRNSFAPQGGLGCDAPYTPDYLQSPTYLNEPRFDCEFRDPATGHCHSPAGYPGTQTCFNPNKKGPPPKSGSSRAQHRPKLLSRGIVGEVKGFWCIEPTAEVLSDLLASPEKRVPLYPFVVALYGGSPYFGQWGSEASRARFEADIGLGHERFSTLFDPDPGSPLNALMISAATAKTGRSRLKGPASPPLAPPPGPPSSLSKPVPYKPREERKLRLQAEDSPDPIKRARMLERARRGHKRTLDALAALMEGQGLEVTEQLDGFDLLATSAETGLLFEIKSWTTTNLSSQIRHGWAQLLEYRYRNRDDLPETVQMYLVLARRPPRDSWAWEFLVEEFGVVPAWIEESKLATFPPFRKLMP